MWTKEMDLYWSNLTVSTEKSFTQKSRPILQNVSGVAKSGELLAIMGTSGAGKTTLLNTLLYQNMYGLEVTHGTRYLNELIGGLGKKLGIWANFAQNDHSRVIPHTSSGLWLKMILGS